MWGFEVFNLEVSIVILNGCNFFVLKYIDIISTLSVTQEILCSFNGNMMTFKIK
jgi:hypothetical protein